MALSFTKQNGLIVVLTELTSLCILLELNMCLWFHFEMAPEDVTAERARVPPVRDKFSRLNPRALSGRRRTGKGRQTSQTTHMDPSNQESLQQFGQFGQQLARLHFQI